MAQPDPEVELRPSEAGSSTSSPFTQDPQHPGVRGLLREVGWRLRITRLRIPEV